MGDYNIYMHMNIRVDTVEVHKKFKVCTKF